MNIVINPKSQQLLSAISRELPQSLLLAGERGVGLATIARGLAGRDLAAFIEPENSKGETDHNTGTVTIEAIRHLYDQTRSKRTKRQIIVIDDADRMSLGAQGAFLKLLEEPTEHTHFVLTSHSPQLLLPTIRSRVQSVVIEPATPDQTDTYLTELGAKEAKKRIQLDFLASGLPAELHRLITNDDYFASRAGVMGDARDLLASPAYKKLLIVHKYYQNRGDTLQLLDSALALTRRSLTQKPQPALVRQLDRLLIVRDKIAANHNIRLQLMDFVLS